MRSTTKLSECGADGWRLHPFWERALVALVLAVVALPGLGTLAGVGVGTAASEREDPRTAAEARSRADGLASRLRLAAQGFEDRFALRDVLVRGQAVARFAIFGISPQPEVIRGSAGWWFYGDDGALDDYVSTTPFSDAELDEWARVLQHTQDGLASRGIGYVFVIAPDKHHVYPEHMPESIRPASSTSRAQQLMAHLAAHTTVHTLDLTSVLVDGKARDRVHHQTDSHWNDVGAMLATREVLTRVQRVAPALTLAAPPPERLHFTRVVRVTPAMDLARMVRLEGRLTETRIELVSLTPRMATLVEPVHGDPDFGEPRVVTQRADGRGPRALVYRDSFGSGLIPFLAESFGRAVFLWEYDVDPREVERERPDVVIHEWASRRLHTRMPYDAWAAAAARQP
jgi:alginate O-acetyltransferase complex protein AlgJ